MAAEMHSVPSECAACGGALPEISRERYGRYKDFCSFECRKAGRVCCKTCGKDLSQESKGRKDFCNERCGVKYRMTGEVSTSYIEEQHRTTCKKCGKSITQSIRGGRRFCNRTCLERYHRQHYYRPKLNDLEKWGQYAPETRKVLHELDNAGMPMLAKRLATAIDCEYSLKIKGSQKYGEMASYICKGCAKEFRRRASSHLSKDYCSSRCRLKAGIGIEDGALKGENNPTAKVTWEQVDEIRGLYASKQASHSKLADMYNVSRSNIKFIVDGKTWKPENDPRRKQASEGKQA